MNGLQDGRVAVWVSGEEVNSTRDGDVFVWVPSAPVVRCSLSINRCWCGGSVMACEGERVSVPFSLSLAATHTRTQPPLTTRYNIVYRELVVVSPNSRYYLIRSLPYFQSKPRSWTVCRFPTSCGEPCVSTGVNLFILRNEIQKYLCDLYNTEMWPFVSCPSHWSKYFLK